MIAKRIAPVAAVVAIAIACSGNDQTAIVNGGGNTAGSFNPTGSGATGGFNPTGGLAAMGGTSAGGGTGGSGQTCDPANSGTSIEGFVYDPADKNPLYNVSVYVPDPASPLPDLDKVPLGCGCSQVYPAAVLATGLTDTTGHFTIPCAPSGTVSLVVQTGKWRRQYDGIAVTAGQTNMAPRMRLPANSTEGSLPNIAISTGGADSLECLPLRIGVSASEYVQGSATGGHIHIYTGHNGATMATGSVDPNQTLWDQQSHLNEHDVVLLSCEGQETTGLTNQGRNFLMSYASAGGRVFASHFHYAWFNTGPFATGANNLATWIPGSQHIDDNQSFPGDIDTTLSTGAAFPEGSALQTWLGQVGALTNNQLPIWFTRHNVKALIQPPSTEWIHLDQSVMQAPNTTQYFSADLPIGGTQVCGRVVYSDLHVSGGPGTNAPGVAPDYPNAPMNQGGEVPRQCAMHALTPQEEALEFMLFDLSSCLVPIGGTAPPPPPLK